MTEERLDAATVADVSPAGRSASPSVGNVERGTIIGRYVVLEPIGRGGMGAVILAFDTLLSRKVAIKVLLSDPTLEEARLRMMREAQAMAQLAHPNVVTVHDVGTHEGNVYVAMEYIQGQTLAQWLGTPRSWRDVLGVLVQAGRGLAAAHAAGIVHRDFKPANVMLANDGRVCVLDFGIATANASPTAGDSPAVTTQRALDDATTAPSADGTSAGPARAVSHSSSGSHIFDSKLTQDGALVGTVGYFAPEVAHQRGVDARSDIFSFCVVLWRALYGTPPFALGLVPYLRALSDKKIPERPPGTRIPSWLHPVMVKGLAPEPADRYASMNALLAELDVARVGSKFDRWARRVGAIAALAAIAAAAVGAARVTAARQARLCAGAEAQVDEVWDDNVKGRIERALLATHTAYAATAWQRTRERLDSYMAEWAAMHEETCRATRIDGHQSEQVMTARMACLGRRRDAVHALTQVLEAADAKVTANAASATFALPALDECKSVTSLLAAEPEPEDPAKRAEIASIRQGLSLSRAKYDTGKYRESRTIAEALVARARQVGYHTVLAEALFAAGLPDGPPEPRTRALEEAIFEADRGRLDSTRAWSAILLMAVAQARGDEWREWSRVAEGALDRSGDGGVMRARWLITLAQLYGVMGQTKEGVARGREALAIVDREGADRYPALAGSVRGNLAEQEAALGETSARQRVAEGDSLVARAFGDDSPKRLRFCVNKGNVEASLGDYRAAYAAFAQGLAFAERVSPDSDYILSFKTGMCAALADLSSASTEPLAKDELRKAVSVCEEALASVTEATGAASVGAAEVHVSLSNILQTLDRYPEARVHAEAALSIFHGLGGNGLNELAANLALGQILLGMGKRDEAIEVLGRTLESASALDATDAVRINVAAAKLSLAEALVPQGSASPRAARLAEESLALAQELRLEPAIREARAWLDAHPMSRLRANKLE